MQPSDHGSQYSSLSTSEASGYARAMLDCIDWLLYEGEPKCALLLESYRNAKLSAPMQPMLNRRTGS